MGYLLQAYCIAPVHCCTLEPGRFQAGDTGDQPLAQRAGPTPADAGDGSEDRKHSPSCQTLSEIEGKPFSYSLMFYVCTSNGMILIFTSLCCLNYRLLEIERVHVACFCSRLFNIYCTTVSTRVTNVVVGDMSIWNST